MSDETVQAAPENNDLPSVEEIASRIMSSRETGHEVADIVEASEAVQDTTPEEGIKTPSETPAEQAEAPKPDRFASKFAAISRKERDMRKREEQISARMTQLETTERELQDRRAQWDNIKKSPLKHLKELGVSYTDLTNDAMGTYEEPTVDPVQARLQEIDVKLARIQELEAKIEGVQAGISGKEYERAEQVLMSGIVDVIRAGTDNFELVSVAGDEGSSLVREVMQQYYDTHKKVLPIEDACAKVEQYYQDNVVERFLATKKVKDLIAAQATAANAKSPGRPEAKSIPPSTTLRHGHSAATKSVDVDTLHRDDAISYLIKKHSMSR